MSRARSLRTGAEARNEGANRVAAWSQEQREVHALFLQQYGHGLGVAIARRLPVTLSRVYRFHRGQAQFPESELGELRSFLLKWVDPQIAVRAELVAWLAQRRGRGTEVARRLGVNKATVSRFRDAAIGAYSARPDRRFRSDAGAQSDVTRIGA